MIQIVNKILKYKYILSSVILTIGLISIIYLSQKRTDIYIVYNENFSNCSNIKDYYKKMYFVICDGNKTILFSKFEENLSEYKSIDALSKLNLITKKELFEQFDDSIKFANKNYSTRNEQKNVNFYIILKNDLKNSIEIIPVGKIRVLS